MKKCHVCKADCEDFAELCPVCGADLSSIENDSTESEVKEIKNPVLLTSIEDVVSVEIFKDILNDNGILFSEGDSGTENAMRVTFGGGFHAVDIYVDNDDFETANKLYSDFSESETEFDGEFFDIEEPEDLIED